MLEHGDTLLRKQSQSGTYTSSEKVGLDSKYPILISFIVTHTEFDYKNISS
jgi:hypothetical protein